MQVLPIERGMLKCVFRYPDIPSQDGGIPGDVYATLSVIGLLVEHGVGAGMKLIPIVLDDTLWTASDFASSHAGPVVMKPLEWEVFETAKGAEADSDSKAPFWFQLFFDAYLKGLPLDFRGTEVPEYVRAKLEYAVASGAITKLRENAWSPNELTASVAAPQQRGSVA